MDTCRTLKKYIEKLEGELSLPDLTETERLGIEDSLSRHRASLAARQAVASEQQQVVSFSEAIVSVVQSMRKEAPCLS